MPRAEHDDYHVWLHQRHCDEAAMADAMVTFAVQCDPQQREHAVKPEPAAKPKPTLK